MHIVSSFGQYSKCLHLFDISRLMPFFFKFFKDGIYSSSVTAKCEANPNTPRMAHTDWGLGPDCTQTFPISIQKSETLLQSSTKEYIIPTGKTQKGV